MGSTGYPESYLLKEKSRACKQQFKKCLEISNIDYDIWLEQKSANFNWWTSGLNADKSGPGSLDARLRLRPDVRDVVADVLDGLESALYKFHQIDGDSQQPYNQDPLSPPVCSQSSNQVSLQGPPNNPPAKVLQASRQPFSTPSVFQPSQSPRPSKALKITLQLRLSKPLTNT
ncbi:hypothetical protein GGR51DRAFT_561261 [Nemania sp. FL0031]|nr:hypothetical protein GGR51DRAFT_561261 [Nemania sp. FL0031]